MKLSLNVIYENGVFLEVFYYQLVVECIIVLFFEYQLLVCGII